MLRTLLNRLPLETAVHLSEQLPLLIRLWPEDYLAEAPGQQRRPAAG